MENVTAIMMQLFLDTLGVLGGKATNKALRAALPGWTEDQYKDTRAELIATKQVLLARGRGGSVRLSEPDDFVNI